MKISTKGRYGVEAMIELALNFGSDPLSIKAISIKQGISECYLEQLFATLRRAKLIESARGAQGGYSLSRAPREITVGEVLNVLEGPVEISKCLDSVKCEKENCCVARVIWSKIQKSINDIVDNITLQDLVDDYNNQKNNHNIKI